MSDKHGYAFGALSPNDPAQVPMRFVTQEEATAHANRMNELIPRWDDQNDTFWNRDHWKQRPQSWVVKPL